MWRTYSDRFSLQKKTYWDVYKACMYTRYVIVDHIGDVQYCGYKTYEEALAVLKDCETAYG